MLHWHNERTHRLSCTSADHSLCARGLILTIHKHKAHMVLEVLLRLELVHQALQVSRVQQPPHDRLLDLAKAAKPHGPGWVCTSVPVRGCTYRACACKCGAVCMCVCVWGCCACACGCVVGVGVGVARGACVCVSLCESVCVCGGRAGGGGVTRRRAQGAKLQQCKTHANGECSTRTLK
jgi:hypothetical protein